ncbi:glycerophosphodiester phosphodiesterase family protein [Rhodoplanes sp. Z2-YC6860]|uniref:glycerophosphodiester phosphodiesterase family protein n=1 Tax=Rhodoplanes sp. Z2-YC6860 TaxID=674703 RepID=UPI00078EB5E6|nr:glycerophosphodiester phosphodiesterase family protein [Rhodoplanes sp. Z2-YC6860]AMN42468.1 glycerophosphoryl diester phosphodiesterase [Rhodoplanes sp. Z2-YC6860]
MAGWLTAQPYAHRGLHDSAAGIIENTPSAFRAAIAGGYGIECDVQISADGEAMVHHDFILGRLTRGNSRLDERSAADLKAIEFFATSDRMLTLGELCDLVAGRVPMLVELKSRFDGDERIAARTAAVLNGYSGAAAAMSFDPVQIAATRRLAPRLPRGLVAQKRETDDPGRAMSRLGYARAVLRACPQFLAYRVQDLTTRPPRAVRSLLRRPVLTWTVRTPEQRNAAIQHADQMIFEGFRP